MRRCALWSIPTEKSWRRPIPQPEFQEPESRGRREGECDKRDALHEEYIPHEPHILCVQHEISMASQESRFMTTSVPRRTVLTGAQTKLGPAQADYKMRIHRHDHRGTTQPVPPSVDKLGETAGQGAVSPSHDHLREEHHRRILHFGHELEKELEQFRRDAPDSCRSSPIVLEMIISCDASEVAGRN